MTNVYETISKRLFGFARWHLTTVRDDDALADIYSRSEVEGANVEGLAREAMVLASSTRAETRTARHEAAALVSLCLAIRREQGDPSEADLYVYAFANDFCIAQAAKEGRLSRYNPNSVDGRTRMLAAIRAASKWCAEYGAIEAPHAARLAELIGEGGE